MRARVAEIFIRGKKGAVVLVTKIVHDFGEGRRVDLLVPNQILFRVESCGILLFLID